MIHPIALLHCIVTDTVNRKLSEYIYNWKQNTDSNTLIQELRKMRKYMNLYKILMEEIEDRYRSHISKNNKELEELEELFGSFSI